jgi:large subunit ribosomal protein L21
MSARLAAATQAHRVPHAFIPQRVAPKNVVQQPRLTTACATVPAEFPPFARRKGATFLSTSEKYAIVDVGGNQHLVEEGRWYTCDRMQVSPGDVVSFGRVLAVKYDGNFHLGAPYVEGVTVEAEIVEHLKGPKVLIYKMKPKKHYKKKVGHRQPMTKFMITKISKE